MYHYLFTNDLRISELDESLKKTGYCFSTNTVPSSSVDKSANNNMMTLGFYFNLNENSNCAKAAAAGNTRAVVLNFIKKFQFPNMRTTKAFNECKDDGIKLAPMRVIVKLLYTMNLLHGSSIAYLTKDEIKDFVFYNEKVAKTKNPDIAQLICDILEYRKTGTLPVSVSTVKDEHDWNQEGRQIREMLKVLQWSGCITEKNGKFVIDSDELSVRNKADVFDIITCDTFWEGSTIESYRDYMDMVDFTVESDENCEDVFNHRLFGIHIKEKNNALSIEDPHVCIGWSDMGDLSDISSKEELAIRYDEHFYKNPRGKGQDVGQVWRFLNDMQIGDYVIFAESSVFHIGRIESDYYYNDEENPEQSADYKNTRTVRWLKKNISRSVLSSNLHRSLMTAMSVFTLNDYKSAVSDLLCGTYVKDEDRTEGEEETMDLIFNTAIQVKYERNRILFGAPGTGKSYTINKELKDLIGEDNEDDYERVTFHPDYSYANFVGTYKPVMISNDLNVGLDKDSRFIISVLYDNKKNAYTDEMIQVYGNEATDGNSVGRDQDKDGTAIRKYVSLITSNVNASDIGYEYVPGPFMRMYVKALKSARSENPKPHLLIIEEINRANVAAVFGDIFQLLDRGDDEVSEYPIQASEDIKDYLAKELGGDPENYVKIRIPDNMFIWATMNSADQGVFPMDTAFKRRWDFTYLGIDDNDKKIRGKYVYLADDKSQKVEWNKLRKAINHFLAKEKINEDKQLGPYFISKSIVVPAEGDEIDRDKFIRVFKNKVIMYLFEDAAKQKRTKLFEGCFHDSTRYSEICKAFEIKGIGIFNHDIQIEAEPEEPLRTPAEKEN